MICQRDGLGQNTTTKKHLKIVKTIEDITACFFDHGGLYLPLAQKLSESYKRVIYADTCEKAFPIINDGVIGDSYPPNERLERTNDFWKHKGDIDLFIFPDVQGAGLQLELESQGFAVWGSRTSDTLELSREKFHRVLAEVGLQVPKFQRVIGLSELRDYLKDKEDQYIKISRYRGSLETFHWRSYDDDEQCLDGLAVKFGGVKDLIPFLVFDAIETDLEVGGDTYCVDGRWPSHMLNGYEWKDKGYFGAFTALNDMPEQITAVMDAFGPVLEQHGHRNFWSMEIRVKGDDFYFIDATPRGPLPATGAQMEIYFNLPEIILHGAHGELIDPVPSAQCVCECVLTQKSEKHCWGSVMVPDDLKQWMKLGGSCQVNGRTWFPPDDSHGEEIGWLVAIGDTPELTIEKQLEQVKLLPDGVHACTESLIDLLKEIKSGEKEGIEFSKSPIPEPDIVIDADA